MIRGRHLLAVGFSVLALAGCGGTNDAQSNLTLPPASSTTPTAAPTTKPTASTAPATSSATTLTVDPASVTFVSTTTGWVLDRATLRLVQTRDGGATWRAVNSPPVQPADAARGIGVRFANATDGFVFAHKLWATHDGGTTWAEQSYPFFTSDSWIDGLEITGRTAYAAVTGDATHRYHLLSSPVDQNTWTEVYASGSDGAPVQSVDLIAQNGRAYAAFNFRTNGGAAIAEQGPGHAWSLPCVHNGGPALVAAWSATGVAVVCSEGTFGDVTKPTVYLSKDGGVTFHGATGDLSARTASVGCVGGASDNVLLAGTAGGQNAALVASFDGAATWQAVWSAAAPGGCTFAGFTSPTQGVAIISGTRGTLLMTIDGGHSWQPNSFRAAS